MKPIYVVMVEDRHTDPYPEVFTDREQAVSYAREQAREWCDDPEDPEKYEEHNYYGHADGWLFYARYSIEGDSVWVVEKVLK